MKSEQANNLNSTLTSGAGGAGFGGGADFDFLGDGASALLGSAGLTGGAKPASSGGWGSSGPSQLGVGAFRGANLGSTFGGGGSAGFGSIGTQHGAIGAPRRTQSDTSAVAATAATPTRNASSKAEDGADMSLAELSADAQAAELWLRALEK